MGRPGEAITQNPNKKKERKKERKESRKQLHWIGLECVLWISHSLTL